MSGEQLSLEGLTRAFQDLSDRPQAGEPCSRSEEIYAAAGGELAPRRVEELLDHTLSCPACLDAWLLAREIQSAQHGKSDGKSTPLAFPARWRRLAVHPGLAAAAVLVMMVGIWRFTVQPPESGVRGGAAQKPTVGLLEAETPCADGTCRLRWEGPSDTRYEVRLLGPALENLLEGEESWTMRPELSLPLAKLLELGADSRLELVVTVDGEERRQELRWDQAERKLIHL